MKKGFLSVAFLIFLLHAFGQSPTQPAPAQWEYLYKSKRQKTNGWILLGGGLATTFLGIAVGNAGTLNGTSGGGSGGAVMALAGIGAMVGSIPVFISAGKNKRRAAAALALPISSCCIHSKKALH
jgi:hypothetical protein